MCKRLKIGESVEFIKEITDSDVLEFAKITKDYNPIHFENEAAKRQGFAGRIVHGMLVGSLFSKLIGTELPGDGSIYVSQTLEFKAPVIRGNYIKAIVTIKDIVNGEKFILGTECYNEDGAEVVTGEAIVINRKYRKD